MNPHVADLYDKREETKRQIVAYCQGRQVTLFEIAEKFERTTSNTGTCLGQLVRDGWLHAERIKGLGKTFYYTAIRNEEYIKKVAERSPTRKKPEVKEAVIPGGTIIRLADRKDGWNSQPLKKIKHHISGASLALAI